VPATAITERVPVGGDEVIRRKAQEAAPSSRVERGWSTEGAQRQGFRGSCSHLSEEKGEGAISGASIEIAIAGNLTSGHRERRKRKLGRRASGNWGRGDLAGERRQASSRVGCVGQGSILAGRGRMPGAVGERQTG
jgi:hypothetical protein